MRRLLPLLALLAAGCGGGGSASSSAVLKIVNDDSEVLAGGVDASGEPVFVGLNRSGALRVVTAKGTATYTVSGAFGATPTIAGNFALLPGGEANPMGTVVVNLKTGVSRIDATEAAVANDGGRVVFSNGSGYVLEDLATGARTTLALTNVDRVVGLAGQRLLTAQATGTVAVGASVYATYTYRVLSLDGSVIDSFESPRSDATTIPRFLLDSAGEVATFDDAYHLVLFDATGASTTPLTTVAFLPLALADDGAVLAQEQNASGRVDVIQAGRIVGRGPSLGGSVGVSASRDGRYVFDDDNDGTLTAYRVR